VVSTVLNGQVFRDLPSAVVAARKASYPSLCAEARARLRSTTPASLSSSAKTSRAVRSGATEEDPEQHAKERSRSPRRPSSPPRRAPSPPQQDLQLQNCLRLQQQSFDRLSKALVTTLRVPQDSDEAQAAPPTAKRRFFNRSRVYAPRNRTYPPRRPCRHCNDPHYNDECPRPTGRSRTRNRREESTSTAAQDRRRSPIRAPTKREAGNE